MIFEARTNMNITKEQIAESARKCRDASFIVSVKKSSHPTGTLNITYGTKSKKSKKSC